MRIARLVKLPEHFHIKLITVKIRNIGNVRLCMKRKHHGFFPPLPVNSPLLPPYIGVLLRLRFIKKIELRKNTKPDLIKSACRQGF